jgi:hypothetical protein
MSNFIKEEKNQIEAMEDSTSKIDEIIELLKRVALKIKCKFFSLK